MTWAINGTLRAAAGSRNGSAPARIFETRGNGGQHGACKFLQCPLGGRRAIVVRHVDDDDRAVVAATEQSRLRLKPLRPIWIHDILAVDPIPAPGEQARGRAAQRSLDRRNLPVAEDQKTGSFACVSPYLIGVGNQRVLRGYELRARTLVPVIPDVQSGGLRILPINVVDEGLRIPETRRPVVQTAGGLLPSARQRRRRQRRRRAVAVLE